MLTVYNAPMGLEYATIFHLITADDTSIEACEATYELKSGLFAEQFEEYPEKMDYQWKIPDNLSENEYHICFQIVARPKGLVDCSWQVHSQILELAILPRPPQKRNPPPHTYLVSFPKSGNTFTR